MKAPEAKAGSYGLPVDIWSLGIFAYELAKGQTPYSNQNVSKILRETPIDGPDFSIDTNKFGDEYQQFIYACLQSDPAARPSIENLLSSDFLIDAESLKPEWKLEYDRLNTNADEFV